MRARTNYYFLFLVLFANLSGADIFTPAETLAQVKLFQNLRNTDAKVRTEAAKQIGELAQTHGMGIGKGIHPGGIAYLRKLLVDSDPNARASAAEAMGEIKILDVRSVSLLYERHQFGTEPEQWVWEKIDSALKKYKVAFQKFDTERQAFMDFANGTQSANFEVLYSGVFTREQIKEQIDALHILKTTPKTEAGVDERAKAAEVFFHLTRNFENGMGPGVHQGAMSLLREYLKAPNIDTREGAANALGMIALLDEETLVLLDRAIQKAVAPGSFEALSLRQAQREHWREIKPVEKAIEAFLAACQGSK